MTAVAPDFGFGLDRGENRGACPRCAESKHRPRDEALSVRVDADGGGTWFCHRCRWAGCWRGARSPHGDLAPSSSRPARKPQERPEAPRQHPSLNQAGRALWGACRPLAGAALEYLRARRCRVPPADGDLRYHEALRHPSGYCGPALVALVRDCITSEPISIHRTWVRPSGKKAEIERPRLLWPKHSKRNGVVQLWPNEAVTTGLCVGEGLETCLAAAHAFAPTWSCIDAGNLAALPVLDGVECLTIVSDNDEPGRKAAETCAQRWSAAGREVHIVMSERPGYDFADALAESKITP